MERWLGKTIDDHDDPWLESVARAHGLSVEAASRLYHEAQLRAAPGETHRVFEDLLHAAGRGHAPTPGKTSRTARLCPRLRRPPGSSPLPAGHRIEPLLGADLSGLTAHLGQGSALPRGVAGRIRGRRLEFRDRDPDLTVQAHEAAHAVQLGLGGIVPDGPTAGMEALEREARDAARAVTSGRPFVIRQRAVPRTYHEERPSEEFPWLVDIFQHVMHAVPSSVRRTLDGGDPARVRAAVADRDPGQTRGQGPDVLRPTNPDAAPPTGDTSTSSGDAVPRAGVGGGYRYMRPIDWDDQAGDGARSITPRRLDGEQANGSLRDSFEANRRVLVEQLFGAGATLERAQAAHRVAALLGAGDLAARIRARLFRVNQYAVVETLDNEASMRYSPIERGGGRSTTCNIYVSDVATALGAYLPVVWWTTAAERRVRAGETVEPFLPDRGDSRPATIRAVNQDVMLEWLRDWGPRFGWRHTDDPDEAQRAANSGHVVVMGATSWTARGGRRHVGHVEIVLAETTGDHDPRDAGGRPRLEAGRQGGRVTDPVESSAGGEPGRGNFRYDTRARRIERGDQRGGRQPGWWRGPGAGSGADTSANGFYIHSGRPSSPVATPEELGYTPAGDERARPPTQRMPAGEGSPVEDVLVDLGTGQPLPPAIRDHFEAAFGTDLTQVRFHQSDAAPRLGALAFTRGEHVVFAPGRFAPDAPEGLALLGHELAHVLQQRAGRVPDDGPAIDPDPALEREARDQGTRAAAGERVAAGGGGAGSNQAVQRQQARRPALAGIACEGVEVHIDMATRPGLRQLIARLRRAQHQRPREDGLVGVELSSTRHEWISPDDIPALLQRARDRLANRGEERGRPPTSCAPREPLVGPVPIPPNYGMPTSRAPEGDEEPAVPTSGLRVFVIGSPGPGEIQAGHPYQFVDAARYQGIDDHTVWIVERSGYELGNVDLSRIESLVPAGRLHWLTESRGIGAILGDFPEHSIQRFQVFSHGVPGQVTLRHGWPGRDDYGISQGEVSAFRSRLFARDAVLQFDSCNTGTTEDGYNLAGDISRRSGREVTAWTGRTSYAEVNDGAADGDTDVEASRWDRGPHLGYDLTEMWSRAQGRDPRRRTFRRGEMVSRAPDRAMTEAELDTGLSVALGLIPSSTGRPLDDHLRTRFGAGLGVDLEPRIHVDGPAQRAADALGARAFTVGQDIYFAAGSYRPETSSGSWLIAHELAHTVQQRGGAPASGALSEPGDEVEREADRAADELVAGRPAQVAARPKDVMCWYGDGATGARARRINPELVGNREALEAEIQRMRHAGDRGGLGRLDGQLRAAQARPHVASGERDFEMIVRDDAPVALAVEDIHLLVAAITTALGDMPAEAATSGGGGAATTGAGAQDTTADTTANTTAEDATAQDASAGWWTLADDDPRLVAMAERARTRLATVDDDVIRVGRYGNGRAQGGAAGGHTESHGGTMGLTTSGTASSGAATSWMNDQTVANPAIAELMSRPPYQRFRPALPAILRLLDHEGGSAGVNTYDEQVLTVGGGFGLRRGPGNRVLAGLPASMQAELHAVGYYPGDAVADTRVLTLAGPPTILRGEAALRSFRLDRRRMAFLHQLLASTEQFAIEGAPGDDPAASDAAVDDASRAEADATREEPQPTATMAGRDLALATQVRVICEIHDTGDNRMPAYALQWNVGELHLALQCRHARRFFHWSDHHDYGINRTTIGTEVCKQFLRRALRHHEGAGRQMYEWLRSQQGSKIEFEGDVDAAWQWAQTHAG